MTPGGERDAPPPAPVFLSVGIPPAKSPASCGLGGSSSSLSAARAADGGGGGRAGDERDAAGESRTTPATELVDRSFVTAFLSLTWPRPARWAMMERWYGFLELQRLSQPKQVSGWTRGADGEVSDGERTAAAHGQRGRGGGDGDRLSARPATQAGAAVTAVGWGQASPRS
jgi:hypothetical protein